LSSQAEKAPLEVTQPSFLLQERLASQVGCCAEGHRVFFLAQDGYKREACDFTTEIRILKMGKH